MELIQHWIDGKSAGTPGAATLPVFDPATGEQIAEVAIADADTVGIAVAAAHAASLSWGRTPATRRAQVLYAFRDLLREHTDDLAALVTLQHGKTLDDARGEVARSLDSVELACGVPALLKGEMSEQTGRNIDTYSTLHPVGVALGITPFNFPVNVPLVMASVAIAAGNAFVLKPSEQDPAPALMLAELFQRAGLPDGVFSVVNGQREAVEALIDHPDISAVSFVGSTQVGHSVYKRAADAGKRAQVFGSAKNHLVVMPDAPLEATADAITAAAFGAAGQRCMAVSVAVAVGDGADALVEALRQRAEAMTMGPGDRVGSELGPVVSEAAQSRIRGLVRRAIGEEGAVPVVDRTEETVETCPGGYFVGPTLLDHVDPASEIYRTEVFGPVLAVVRVDSLQRALELIKDHEYGNGASIFTDSAAAAHTFQREAAAGMVGLNVPIPVPIAPYAASGWKRSTFGDTGLNDGAWRFYTKRKHVTARWDADVTGVNFGSGSGSGLRPN